MDFALGIPVVGKARCVCDLLPVPALNDEVRRRPLRVGLAERLRMPGVVGADLPWM